MCVSLLDSETLAALGTTTGEHGTTTLSGHTGTEAMGLGTLTLIRLIRFILSSSCCISSVRGDADADIDT